MGFLDNSSITVDAILTTYATRKIANGSSLDIRYFGLSDDQIDYKLWNEGHTGGSDKYGDALENLPMLEASTSMLNNMRYRLGPGNINNLVNPYILVDFTHYELNYANRKTGAEIVTPMTANFGSEETYRWVIYGEQNLNYSPGGEKIEHLEEQAFLPEGTIDNVVVIDNAASVEFWAAPVKTKQYATVQLEGTVTGKLATIRFTINKNIFS